MRRCDASYLNVLAIYTPFGGVFEPFNSCSHSCYSSCKHCTSLCTSQVKCFLSLETPFRKQEKSNFYSLLNESHFKICSHLALVSDQWFFTRSSFQQQIHVGEKVVLVNRNLSPGLRTHSLVVPSMAL